MSRRIITLGTWDGKPIEWIVLKEEDFGTLVLSKNILFQSKFDDSSNIWKDSYIRRYLNNDFFNHFTNLEKKKILNSLIYENIDDVFAYFEKRKWEKKFDVTELPKCKDNIFLLSIALANEVLTTDELNLSKEWWLCTINPHKDHSKDNVFRVDDKGCIYSTGITRSIGVRPAMYIREK